MDLQWLGPVVGLCSFLIIGMFHPIVIKTEYYTGTRFWWVFLIVGLGALVAALLIDNLALSAIVGVFAFCCFWSILELFEQKERVRKGWFPKRPDKKKQ
ncbi:MAG: DUF4491 family protein [Bacteroidaceae bacterium]